MWCPIALAHRSLPIRVLKHGSGALQCACGFFSLLAHWALGCRQRDDQRNTPLPTVHLYWVLTNSPPLSVHKVCIVSELVSIALSRSMITLTVWSLCFRLKPQSKPQAIVINDKGESGVRPPALGFIGPIRSAWSVPKSKESLSFLSSKGFSSILPRMQYLQNTIELSVCHFEAWNDLGADEFFQLRSPQDGLTAYARLISQSLLNLFYSWQDVLFRRYDLHLDFV